MRQSGGSPHTSVFIFQNNEVLFMPLSSECMDTTLLFRTIHTEGLSRPASLNILPKHGSPGETHYSNEGVGRPSVQFPEQ